MIILDSSTKLQVILAAAVTANQSAAVISYTDLSSGTPAPAIATATSNSTTAVDALAAPASGSQRLIKSIFLLNADTAPITITFRTNNGGTLATVFTVMLAVGDNAQYEDGKGWFVIDSSGNHRLSSYGTYRLLRAPQILTSGTSYTIPTGCTAIEFEEVGGGGGGGGIISTSSLAAAAGGGGAGGYLRKFITNPQTSAITYAIGAAGAAGASTPGNGGTGGNTSITINSVTYTANGGTGGVSMSGSATAGFAACGGGGTATNGDINYSGANGGQGIRLSGTVAVSGYGGSTLLGGGGRTYASDSVGEAGVGYGAGGSGAMGVALTSGAAGGAGAQGVIIIREYA